MSGVLGSNMWQGERDRRKRKMKERRFRYINFKFPSFILQNKHRFHLKHLHHYTLSHILSYDATSLHRTALTSFSWCLLIRSPISILLGLLNDCSTVCILILRTAVWYFDSSCCMSFRWDTSTGKLLGTLSRMWRTLSSFASNSSCDWKPRSWKHSLNWGDAEMSQEMARLYTSLSWKRFYASSIWIWWSKLD